MQASLHDEINDVGFELVREAFNAYLLFARLSANYETQYKSQLR